MSAKAVNMTAFHSLPPCLPAQRNDAFPARLDAPPDRPRGLRDVVREVAADVRRRMVGRDLALIAAGLTFYAGIAVVPVLVLACVLVGSIRSLAARVDGETPQLRNEAEETIRRFRTFA